jgi:hypothetical protein
MEYELRDWYDDCCLYTNDRRVKDLALHSTDLTVVASYFKSLKEAQPFAWDIVGPRPLLSGISKRFSASGKQLKRG